MGRPVYNLNVRYHRPESAAATDDYTVTVDSGGRLCGDSSATVPFAAVVEAVATGGQLNAALLDTDGGGWAESAAAAAGQRLFDRLLPSVVGEEVRKGVREANRQGAFARLLVRFAATPGTLVDHRYLHEVPWELLQDSAVGGFLALHPDVLLSRYVEHRQAAGWLGADDGPVHAAVLTASPSDLPRLDVARDLADIRRRLHPAARVEGTAAGRWRDADKLRTARPVHLLHLGMHGGVAGGQFRLAFAGADGRAEWVTHTQLVDLIADLPELRLVVLNTCQSAEKVGLTQTLAELNVPAVIGHRTKVSDPTAVRFSGEFYDLLPGLPVDQAVREARKRVKDSTAGRLDWVLPVLYLRTPEPVVLPAARTYREVDEFGDPQFPPSAASPPAPTPARPTASPSQPASGGFVVDFGGAKVGKMVNVESLLGSGTTSSAAPAAGMTVKAAGAEVKLAVNLQTVVLSADQIAALFRALDSLQ